MIKTIEDVYFEHSKECLVFSSKYCGIREIDKDLLFNIQKSELINEIKSDLVDVIYFTIRSSNFYFLVKKLTWDTDFFNRPMFKLLAILTNSEDFDVIDRATNLFVKHFRENAGRNAYCSIEVPSESNVLIQALTGNGFRLVETRIHHYLKDIKNFEFKRFQVRQTTEDDSDTLAIVASKTRNKYDRFHSDVKFENDLADKYLGRFASEAVRGLADKVLVPNEPDVLPNALFAVNLLKEHWNDLGVRVSQLVLAASDPLTCKGWYEKLLSEICYFLRDNDVDYLITNTQTTNKSPIHVNEKLGFKYSHTTHILTISND